MKDALLLHGAGNNSQGNWFPWLRKELEKKGYVVWSPDLPNSDHPIQKEWLETIFSNKDFKFGDETILVGHSAGGSLILRILEQLPDGVKINKAILVAGPIDKGSIPEFWKYKEDLTKEAFNWEKIKNSSEEFYLIYSDNDPYDCGIRHGEIIKDKVGGELIFQKGEGHFNLEVGEQYKEFPLLLTLLA